MKKIFIRPHHLLCIQGFQGYGYSSEFTKNMRNIIDYINSKENKVCLQIVITCDDICEKCPNNQNHKCVCEEVNIMDKKVIEELSLKEGQVLESVGKEVFSKVNKNLKNSMKCNYICGKCSWHNVCLWFNEACKL